MYTGTNPDAAEIALERVREAIRCLVDELMTEEGIQPPRFLSPEPRDVRMHLGMIAGKSPAPSPVASEPAAIAAAATDLLHDLDEFEGNERLLACLFLEAEADPEGRIPIGTRETRDGLVRAFRRIAGNLVELHGAAERCAGVRQGAPELFRPPLWRWESRTGYTPECRRWVEAVHSAAIRTAGKSEVWVRSDTAAKCSGLDPSTIRKRAQREGWKEKRAGKLRCYLLDNLNAAWPDKEFLPSVAGQVGTTAESHSE